MHSVTYNYEFSLKKKQKQKKKMEKKEVNVEKEKKKEGKEGRETGREGGRWEERKQVSKQKVVLFPSSYPFPWEHTFMCWGFTLAKVSPICLSKAGAEHSWTILWMKHKRQAGSGLEQSHLSV